MLETAQERFQQGLIRVTEAVFPSAKSIDPVHLGVGPRYFAPYSEIHSSLALQILIYFNVFYSILFGCSGLLIFWWKLDQRLPMRIEIQIIAVILHIMWVLVEPGRLLLGYTGNLVEKVPHLAAFFLVTIFPQLPIVIFFMFLQDQRLPFDLAANLVQLLFMIPEIILSFFQVRRLIRVQATAFYLQWRAAANDSDGLLGDDEDEDKKL